PIFFKNIEGFPGQFRYYLYSSIGHFYAASFLFSSSISPSTFVSCVRRYNCIPEIQPPTTIRANDGDNSVVHQAATFLLLHRLVFMQSSLITPTPERISHLSGVKKQHSNCAVAYPVLLDWPVISN